MSVISASAVNWGFTSNDVLSNSMALFSTLAGFVLLGIAIAFAPRLITLIKSAILGRSSSR
ncbi:hypothetical protein SAMN04489725_11611 [Alicyclobacillus hesperidum]|uniref:Uncharacterized protein n=1 Tax=Alicyclobacillus hesperidum TaxID=89784 RepID=A0A1H2WQ54_9BACL|nr:hypothetical protein SAMN04489725_11611 [Alicyclobacillus hesperidum]